MVVDGCFALRISEDDRRQRRPRAGLGECTLSGVSGVCGFSSLCCYADYGVVCVVCVVCVVFCFCEQRSADLASPAARLLLVC